MTAVALLAVAATVYAGPYVGQPLYCDQGQGLVYRLHPASPDSQATAPWVALDVTEFQSGRVHCGDPVLLRFPQVPRSDGGSGGATLRARALDAGHLYPHYIADVGDPLQGTGLPIAVDVPAHLAPFPGLSARAEIHLSAAHPHLTRSD